MAKNLASKLGIKTGNTICVINGDSKTIVQLRKESGESSRFVNGVIEGCDIILVWLTPSHNPFELMSSLQTKIKSDGRIWVIIPKKEVCRQKKIEIDWSRVQAEILRTHLVDNKITSINEEEYGTQFVIRKKHRDNYA